MKKSLLATQIAAIGKATAESLAGADSVAYYGVLGFAKAALLAAAITGAFEVAKAGVSATFTPAKFATGGLVPGQGNSDSVPAMLTPGEIVMNKQASQAYLPLLSHLNSISGGVAFASGGLVPGSPPRAMPINDGGLIARQLGGVAAGIDYKALAQAMTQVTVEANFVAFDRGRARYDNARAHSTLG